MEQNLLEINIHRWPFIFLRREQSLSSRAIGWTSLTVMLFASATYNMFAKPLTGALSPFSLLFLSELLTLGFLLVSFGFVPIFRSLVELPRGKALPLLWVGILSGTAAPLLWFSGLHMTTAVNANLFGNMEMVFLVLFAVFVLGEEWTARHAAAGITISTGVLIIALQGLGADIALRLGDLLIILASFTFSLGSITFRKYLHHVEPQIAIFVRSCTAITSFFLASPFLEHPFIGEVRAFPTEMITALIGFGFISRFLNIFMFYGAIERLPIATVSLVSNVSVVLGVLFAHWYLLEPILWYHWVGGAFILLGTFALEIVGVHPTETHLERHLTQERHHRP